VSGLRGYQMPEPRSWFGAARPQANQLGQMSRTSKECGLPPLFALESPSDVKDSEVTLGQQRGQATLP